MNAPFPHLILLKGAPAVGKSTTAKLLASHFPSGVRIEVDTLRQMVISVNWTDQAEHRSILTLSAQLAAGFLRSGLAPVLLIDTFSGDKIDPFLAAFHSECPNRQAFVVVLHASDDVLRERMLNRDSNAFRDIAIATRINHESVLNAKSSDLVLDTSTLSSADVAREIVTALRELAIRAPMLAMSEVRPLELPSLPQRSR